jgi:predicted O-linked N-acetylglucosamine transferase (SPINDLY family)
VNSAIAAGRDARALRRHYETGVAHARANRLEPALKAFRAGLAIVPDHKDLRYLAATALARLDRVDEAVDEYRRVLALDPRHGPALEAIGLLLARASHPGEALTWFQRALEVNPDEPRILLALVTAAISGEKFAEAMAGIERLRRIDPEAARGFLESPLLRTKLGQVEAGRERFRAVLTGGTSGAIGVPNLYMAYLPGITRAELLSAHRIWAAALEQRAPRGRLDFPNPPDPARRPRLGIACAEMSSSAPASLTLPAFEALARQGWEIHAFRIGGAVDRITERFRSATIWHDLVRGGVTGRVPTGEAEALRAIEAAGIDILFDLSGITQLGRPEIFARRAAPIQVAWAGYPGTTGLGAMDAIIADDVEIRPGEEADYTERPIRLPGCYVSWDPPADAPTPSPPPALANGFVTFGSFNKAEKFNAPLARVWAEIILAVPGSRLLFARRQFGPGPLRDSLTGLMAEAGIPAERIDFLQTPSQAALLEAHGRIDVMLDPMPYSGGVTTLESLWMGVPVVTMVGETFAGRHSASHLRAAGLADWVTPDTDAYVRRAIAAAADLPALAALRASLRDRVEASPLRDADRFAHHLGAALQDLWHDWCRAKRAQAPAP